LLPNQHKAICERMGIENMELQFAGIDGVTKSCINAVLRYLQFEKPEGSGRKRR
jgi:hypothetical protein